MQSRIFELNQEIEHQQSSAGSPHRQMDRCKWMEDATNQNEDQTPVSPMESLEARVEKLALVTTENARLKQSLASMEAQVTPSLTQLPLTQLPLTQLPLILLPLSISWVPYTPTFDTTAFDTTASDTI